MIRAVSSLPAAVLQGAGIPLQLARTGGYYGWLVVASAALSVGVTFGMRAAFGVLLVALVDAFGWGRGLTAGAISLNALAATVGAPFMGMLLDRWGPRTVYSSAALLIGLGLALAALVQHPWQLYLALGVLAGLPLSSLHVNGQGISIAQWFARQRGVAMALVATGSGAGVFLLAPLTEWIVGQGGWQAGFLALAGLFLVVVAPLNLLVLARQPKDSRVPAELGPTGSTVPVRLSGPNARTALHSSRFWALCLGWTLATVPFHLLLAHSIAYLIDLGFSAELAVRVIGLSGAGAIGGMVLWGWVADHWTSEWAFTAGSLALMASIGVLWIAQGQEGLLYVYAALLALGFGSRQGLAPYMGAALTRGPAFGTLSGVLGMHIMLGIALGPVLGGWLFDQSDNYQSAFSAALLCILASVACVWLAAPRRGLLAHSAAE